MYKRTGGHCLKCGRCCKSFNLLCSGYDSFKKARKKYGLRLIFNKDGTYRCNMLDERTNLCKIHKNKPEVCKDAPRVPFPWKCGYEFTEVKHSKKDTIRAIHLLEEVPLRENIDFQTQEALDYGRRYLAEMP